MAVRVGSARSDEHGGSGWAGNAKAGDQKNGAEVSTQDWYLHNKGWVLIRAKDASVREKIAYAMQRACDNNKIGYDQSQRLTAQEWCEKHNNYDPGAITDPVETDCSALVRLCCAYAGIKVKYFNTANENDVLKATGKFDIITDSKYTTSSDYLLRGDILNTKTQGHTVVVLSNGSKAAVVKGTYVYNNVCYDDEFDPIYYSNKYADLKKAFGTDAAKLLEHYVVYGKKEGRIAKASKEPAMPVSGATGTGVAKQDMNVRTGGSTNDKIIGLIKKGEKVQIIEVLSSGWMKIVWPKEKSGFAYVSNRNNAYFTVNMEFPYTVQVTADALYIREGPGTEYNTVGVVHKGEKYVITTVENEKWAKLQNGKGYISLKYAKKV